MARSMISQTGPTLSSPRWAGDYMDREHLVPGGARVDPTQFVDALNGTRVTLTANAALNAVALTVSPLTNPIPAGVTIDFGTNKFARLTAAAAAGATALAVAAIPTALVIGDTGIYAPNGTKLMLPSGTIVGRTYAERDAGTPFGAPADTDEEFYIVAFERTDINYLADIELYRQGSVVYENYLPDFAGKSATIKAAIRSRYVCSIQNG